MSTPGHAYLDPAALASVYNLSEWDQVVFSNRGEPGSASEPVKAVAALAPPPEDSGAPVVPAPVAAVAPAAESALAPAGLTRECPEKPSPEDDAAFGGGDDSTGAARGFRY